MHLFPYFQRLLKLTLVVTLVGPNDLTRVTLVSPAIYTFSPILTTSLHCSLSVRDGGGNTRDSYVLPGPRLLTSTGGPRVFQFLRVKRDFEGLSLRRGFCETKIGSFSTKYEFCHSSSYTQRDSAIQTPLKLSLVEDCTGGRTCTQESWPKTKEGVYVVYHGWFFGDPTTRRWTLCGRRTDM